MELRKKLVSGFKVVVCTPNEEINYFRLNKPKPALFVAFSTFEKPRDELVPEEEQGQSKLLRLSQEVISRTGWIHVVMEQDSVPGSVCPHEEM